MANEESGQEKTLDPTPRRLEKAREEGQVARSIELPTAAVLITATLFFSLAGNYLFHRLGQLFTSQLQFDRKIMDKAELLPGLFFQSIIDGYLLILPVMVLLAVVAVISTVLSGGLVLLALSLIAAELALVLALHGGWGWSWLQAVLAEQLSGEQSKQSLAELAEQQKRMREALEKSAEILKRAALEGAMQTLKDEATELAKAQRDAAGDSARKANDPMKKLEQRTQQLAKDLEALKERQPELDLEERHDHPA